MAHIWFHNPLLDHDLQTGPGNTDEPKGRARWVMGIKEGTCWEEHWVLYVSDESLNSILKPILHVCELKFKLKKKGGDSFSISSGKIWRRRIMSHGVKFPVARALSCLCLNQRYNRKQLPSDTGHSPCHKEPTYCVLPERRPKGLCHHGNGHWLEYSPVKSP